MPRVQSGSSLIRPIAGWVFFASTGRLSMPSISACVGYARGPLSLRYAKQAVNAAADLPVEAGLELEADLIARCFASEDGQRGLGSFVDDGPGQATFLGR
jgi:enoyl-CoA hydratase/carnithine racemase